MRLILMSFSSSMTKPQRIAGAVYLPIHIFGIPLVLGAFAQYYPGVLNLTAEHIVYYGLGFVFCFTAMFRFLRRDFDVLLDNLVKVIFAVALFYFVWLTLSYALASLMYFVMGDVLENNPNDMAISEITDIIGLGPMMAISIFLAPLIEEVLFRGLAFGVIREKSRFWAYFISIALFGVYHVWQFFLDGADWNLLLYALQYLPAGYALARCYEQTNSIWTPVLLHMTINAVGMLAM